MESVKQDYTLVQIQASSGPGNAAGVIQFFIPAGVYECDSDVIVQNTVSLAATQRVFQRQDCCTNCQSNNTQVIIDGVQRAQYVDLRCEQLAWYQKYTEGQTGRGWASVNITNSVIQSWTNCGIGTAGAVVYGVTFKLRHFFAGIFGPDQKYFQVRNQANIQLGFILAATLGNVTASSGVVATADSTSFNPYFLLKKAIGVSQIDEPMVSCINQSQYLTPGAQAFTYAYSVPNDEISQRQTLACVRSDGTIFSFDDPETATTPPTLNIQKNGYQLSFDSSSQVSVSCLACAGNRSRMFFNNLIAMWDQEYRGTNIQLQVNITAGGTGANVFISTQRLTPVRSM